MTQQKTFVVNTTLTLQDCSVQLHIAKQGTDETAARYEVAKLIGKLIKQRVYAYAIDSVTISSIATNSGGDTNHDKQ